LYEVQFINKNEYLSPSNYLTPISKVELEAQKKVQEKDIKIQCINALHEICSYIYTYSFRPRGKFTGAFIASLDLIKTHKDLLQSLGISYLEEKVLKASILSLLGSQKGAIRVLINVKCNENLEIIIDIRKFVIDEIIKFALNDNPIKDLKNISDILECLHSRIK